MLTGHGERCIVQIEFKGQKISNFTLLSEQGFSNENYSFISNKKTYLFRKFKLEDRNRKLEFEIQTLAYKKGLAAKPFVLNVKDGYMVCEFLKGYHKEKLNREDIALIVILLKSLHSLKIEQQPLELKTEFSIFNETLTDAFEIIENSPKEMVLCHNDLNPKNCIFADNSLKFIDWEFAAMNDKYFDLAAISVEFHFELIDDAYFLASYFGIEGWNKKKFDAYKVVYKALCEEWFKENL